MPFSNYVCYDALVPCGVHISLQVSMLMAPVRDVAFFNMKIHRYDDVYLLDKAKSELYCSEDQLPNVTYPVL